MPWNNYREHLFKVNLKKAIHPALQDGKLIDSHLCLRATFIQNRANQTLFIRTTSCFCVHAWFPLYVAENTSMKGAEPSGWNQNHAFRPTRCLLDTPINSGNSEKCSRCWGKIRDGDPDQNLFSLISTPKNTMRNFLWHSSSFVKSNRIFRTWAVHTKLWWTRAKITV